jgi:hypothetical protein
VATEDIQISVSFEGADAAVGGATRVARGVDAMGDAAETAARQQQLAATQAIAFGQRIAGAANAVQGLIGQLGGQSRTAGLIGATIQTSTQFAQLGSALGPQGALVGGIVGALIPAMRELINAQDEAAQSARALAAEEELLTERGQRMAEERRRQVQSEVDSGHILTLSEEEISRATALAAERRTEVYEDLQRVVVALQRAEEQGMDHTSGRFQEWSGQAATLREELRAVTSQINALDQATLSRGQAASADENEAASASVARRRPSGGGADARADAAIAARERIEAAYQSAADQEAAALARAMEAEAQQDAMRERYFQNQAERADAEDAKAQELADRDQERLEQLGRMQDAALEAQAAHTQAVTEQAQSTAASLISSMTDVISQMAEGNATAEEGAQLMLASFLQAISQRAGIEALAQVAQAIGSYPDVAGIAAHAAAALAWGAVAVATGVGGSAISADVSRAQSARQQAERPAAPRSEGVTEGKGGGTTVINFHGPVMTAQGRATFGRMLNELGDEGRQRWAA